MATIIRDNILCWCDWQYTTRTATISCGCVFACIKAESICAFGTVLCICIKAGHVWIMHSWAIIWAGKNSPGLLWGFLISASISRLCSELTCVCERACTWKCDRTFISSWKSQLNWNWLTLTLSLASLLSLCPVSLLLLYLYLSSCFVSAIADIQ